MASIDPQEHRRIRVGETRTPAVSFVGVLESGELLTGTPTVAEVTTTDLTIANVVVNTAALTIGGTSVAVGQAVQFKMSGQLVASSPYTLAVTASTDASPAQTIKRNLTMYVDA